MRKQQFIIGKELLVTFITRILLLGKFHSRFLARNWLKVAGNFLSFMGATLSLTRDTRKFAQPTWIESKSNSRIALQSRDPSERIDISLGAHAYRCTHPLEQQTRVKWKLALKMNLRRHRSTRKNTNWCPKPWQEGKMISSVDTRISKRSWNAKHLQTTAISVAAMLVVARALEEASWDDEHDWALQHLAVAARADNEEGG